MIQAEDNIPVPSHGNAKSKYPWKTMKVGQSFIYDGKRASVSAMASRFGKETNKKFTVRVLDGGVRVWRTA